MPDEIPSSHSAREQLHRLFADEWEFRLQEDPLLATYAGDHRFNDRLPQVSEADFERRAGQARAFLEQLRMIDREALSPADQLNYDIFARILSIQLGDFEYGVHYLIVNKAYGPQAYLPELVDIMPFRTAADYAAYLARLHGFKDHARQLIDLMRAGMRRGYLPARPALQGIDDSLQGLIVAEAEQSVLFEPLQRLPPEIAETERTTLLEAGRAAILESVVPGFQDLLEFIQTEYLPAAREQVGVAALPDGRAYYQHCVRKFTTLQLTPEQVHQTGLAEVRRIRAEMEAVIRKTGFQGSFHEFLEFLRTEPRFYVDTPEALLKEVALILKKMDGELPGLFKQLPRTPYGIRSVPDHLAPYTTTAYYFLPSGDGTKAGFYYVNTYDLKSRPLYEYEALSLHEAVPGHHLQLALQLELTGVPHFRRYADLTAFIEGWALYAERLGLEVGFYQDPYNDFGRLVFEMWRAARLVVDTGLHYLGWTRPQAIDFMVENTALALLNIENEIDRYIAWPGQALAYKIGELKLRGLREQAEHELGPRFDLRDFHAVVLEQGSLPLDVLAEKVRSWIANAASLNADC